jgi:hypothetical protein
MKNLFKPLCFIVDILVFIVLFAIAPCSMLTVFVGLPIAVWFTNAVHESSHLLLYILLKIRWTRLTFSYWTIFYDQEGMSLKFDPKSNLYGACCSCDYDTIVPLWKYRIALMSGGVICAVLGLICLLLCLNLDGACRTLLICIGIAFIMNAVGNLLFPFSPDRVLLNTIVKDRR